MEKKWCIREIDEKIVDNLVKETGESALTLRILVGRGILDPEEINKFLYSQIENLHSPFLLNDMNKAVMRIEQAIKNNEKILIWGDEDADGTTSTVCLKQGLKSMGVDTDYYIPNRDKDGIGLSIKRIQKAKEQNISVIITADCGSRDKEKVLFAKNIGIDCIITDHHEIMETFPFLVNPKLSNYPFKNLAGVGVAYKFVQALSERLRKPFYPESLTPLVLLGSVADRVPITGENRILAKSGLNAIQDTASPGIKALGKIKTIDDVIKKAVSVLSAGRGVSKGYIGYDLLLAKNTQEANRIGRKLLSESKIWQDTARELYRNLVTECIDKGVIFLVDYNIPSRFAGYLASRLKDRYEKPAIVIGEKNKGEGRAPKNFNLFEALKYCSSTLKAFGGHKKACGFKLKEDADTFIQKFLEYSKDKIIDSEPHFDIDSILSPENITPSVIKDMRKLAPFGSGNPKPIFLAKDVSLKQEGNRLLLPGEREIDIPYKGKEYIPIHRDGEPLKLDILYSIKQDGGLVLRDIRPSKFNW